MNRLSSISIENFKSYGASQKIPLKPLTLIFGPNSGGKSSIFHALAFLKWCHSTNGNCNPGDVELGWETVSLGGSSNFVHGHDISKDIKIGLGFKEYLPSQELPSEYQIEWSFKSNEKDYVNDSCQINVDGEARGLFVNVGGGNFCWRGKILGLYGLDQNIRDSQASDDLWFYKAAWEHFASNEKDPEPTFAPDRDDPSRDELTRLSDKFRVACMKYLEDSGVSLDGMYPGHYNCEDRYPKALPYPYKGPYQNCYQKVRQRMIQGLLSGNLSDEDRWNFFDMVLKREIHEGWRIPEDLGAHWFNLIAANHLHIGPLRQPPSRDLDEKSLLGQAKWKPWADLIRDERLRMRVSESLKTLEVPYEVVIRSQETRTYYPDSDSGSAPEFSESQKVLGFRHPKEESTSVPITPARITSSHLDLGFGVSAILPVIVALESDFQLLSIEQPELHIHPRLQANLGDLLIARALRVPERDELDSTILIETHSEHLILRILRRIRETAEGEIKEWPKALREACPNGISPEDVAVLYVEPGLEGATVIELPITPDGDFTRPWPNGFFDERFNEYE